MNRKHIPISGNILQQRASSFYENFKKGSTEQDIKPFTASRGWLNRFKSRYNFKNLQITGEAASADEEAVATFPAELKKIIEEKGYHPKQVFNCNETDLLWKKMPSRTYIHKTAKQAPGFKACKDRLTLLLCVNVEGHVIKPGVIHPSQHLRALKNKDKRNLPVF